MSIPCPSIAAPPIFRKVQAACDQLALAILVQRSGHSQGLLASLLGEGDVRTDGAEQIVRRQRCDVAGWVAHSPEAMDG